MTKIDKFEDLDERNVMVYNAANQSSPLSQDFILKDQIRKSAISILSNVHKDFEPNNTKQFLYFNQQTIIRFINY